MKFIILYILVGILYALTIYFILGYMDTGLTMKYQYELYPGQDKDIEAEKDPVKKSEMKKDEELGKYYDRLNTIDGVGALWSPIIATVLVVITQYRHKKYKIKRQIIKNTQQPIE